MKYNPGHGLLSIVFDDKSLVSTPPSVTSAVRYPSVPAGLIIQCVKLSAIPDNDLSCQSANGFSAAACHHNDSSASTSFFGRYSASNVRNNSFGRARLTDNSTSHTSISGNRLISSISPSC